MVPNDIMKILSHNVLHERRKTSFSDWALMLKGFLPPLAKSNSNGDNDHPELDFSIDFLVAEGSEKWFRFSKLLCFQLQNSIVAASGAQLC